VSNNHQDFEADWWGSCANTYGEESKQIVYARLMNLSPQNLDGHWPVYDIDGGSVLDIGGGPSSMLLVGAFLKGADLSDADLVGAFLKGADLSDVDLSGAVGA